MAEASSSSFCHVYHSLCSSPFIKKLPSTFLPLQRRPSISVSAHKKSTRTEKASVSTGFGKRPKVVTKDPWESLFEQLEEDLENDAEDLNDDDITEEDLLNFEKEVESVLKDFSKSFEIDKGEENDTLSEGRDVRIIDAEGHEYTTHDEDNDEDWSDDEFEEPRKVHLEKWQLRKLAAAAEVGRRKVNIKSLAAELKLERDDVLSFLKSPPPELLMIANEVIIETDEDEKDEPSDVEICIDEKETMGKSSATTETKNVQLQSGDVDSKLDLGPRDWIKGKRLRKVHIATLERVYKRTKWPTNAMIQSIVQITSLPRRRILDWFEEQRKISGSKHPPKHSETSKKRWKKPVTHSFGRHD